jgi:hypothetical protein
VTDDTLWIVSTRDPDGEPVCELTWKMLQWYAPVDAVRQTALDLVTCAAYAEMMMELIVTAKLPPATVKALTISLLRGCGRTGYGHADTIEVMPAGGVHESTGKRQAAVVFARGKVDGWVTAEEARGMAGQWLAVAEATESDQLVAEAYRSTHRGNDAGLERLFGYLRKQRDG